MAGEIPERDNIRGGPGWWLDPDGMWRAPAEWPEDYPPLDGWIRGADGRWGAPGIEEEHVLVDHDGTARLERRAGDSASVEGGLRLHSSQSRPATTTFERPVPAKRSRQAEADIRAMLLVGGAIATAIVLILVALVLQSRAGAAADAIEPTEEAPPEVIFAAETDAVREQRRAEAIAAAPAVARAELDSLVVADGVVNEDATADQGLTFDESEWVPVVDSCLGVSEQVLVARTSRPIVWADNLECIPAEGQWVDNYLGIDINRRADAEVRSLIPLELVHAAGGAQWTPATRAEFLTDTEHPATLVILAADSGHNPRNAGPAVWRPSNESSWCGYAVDWIGVKARWELSVSTAERDALSEMLDSCGSSTSNGPHPSSAVIDPINPPVIDRIVE